MRLRIAGSNGQQVFDSDALSAIHRYSKGIPRVVNLLCEHCLVSSFVDQQKMITGRTVEAVAQDFDLQDAVMAAPVAHVKPSLEQFDVVEALKALTTLADKLRQGEAEIPRKGSHEPNS